MTSTRCMPVRSGKRFVKIDDSLDRGQVCTDSDDDNGGPDITGEPAEDQDDKGFGPAEKSNTFQGIIDLPFHFFLVPDLGIHDRFDEGIHQLPRDRDSDNSKISYGRDRQELTDDRNTSKTNAQ